MTISKEEVQSNFDSKVSQTLQSLFVIDIVLERDKPITYILDYRKMVHRLGGKQIYGKITVNLKTDPSEQQMKEFILSSFDDAEISFSDTGKYGYKLFYNPKDNTADINETALYWLNQEPIILRDGTIAHWIAWHEVPQGFVYFMPYPDYFGCITLTEDKFDAFCFPEMIIKKSIRSANPT